MRGRCWSCILLLLLCMAPAQAALRVVLDDNYPPYSFRDAHGVLQGERVEIWQAWSAVSHIPVQIEGAPWAQVIEDFAAGRADVIDTIFLTPDRQRHYRFSMPYARIPVRIYFRRQLTGIHDGASLQGYSIAAKRGDACVKALAAEGLQSLRLYPDYTAIIDAAEQSQVLVFCMDQPSAIYLLGQRGLLASYRTTSQVLDDGKLAWAVSLDRPDLYGLIERGYARLPPQQVQAIEQKWQGEEIAEGPWYDSHRHLIWVMISALIIILFLIVWSQSLRRQVTLRTRALRHALQSVREARSLADTSRQGLEALIEAIPDILLEVDVHAICLSCRLSRHEAPAGAEIFMQAIGRPLVSVLPEAAVESFQRALEEAQKQGWSRAQTMSLDLAGMRHWFELLVGRQQGASGKSCLFVVLLHDITRSKFLEDELLLHRSHLESLVQAKTHELQEVNQQLRLQARLLRARSRSSQVLIRAVDERTLQNEVCRILVEECGHRMAAVSYVIADEAQTIRPMAWAGSGTDYLQMVHLSWGDNPHGHGPAGTSLRQGRPVRSMDSETDPQYRPWREEALRRGFLSSIALPFSLEDGQRGVFSIYAGVTHGFPDEEVALLSELVADFAYGNSVLRLRNRQSETLAELRRHIETEQKAREEALVLSAYLREVLNALDSAITVWGPDRRLRLWNQSLLKMFPQRKDILQTGIDHDEYRQRLLASGLELVPFSPWDEWDDSSQVTRSSEGRIVEYSRLSISDGSRIVIISDITELIQMRELMQRSERLAGLGRLVAGVAHELNTPIGVALTASTHLTHGLRQLQTITLGQTLSRQKLQDLIAQEVKATGLIERSLLRAIDLISNFKQVAVDQASEVRRTFDLGQVLHEVAETLRVLLRPEGHELVLEGPVGLQMDSFPGGLGQVISNLVTNAMAHAYGKGESGHLRLVYEALGSDRVRLQFSDDGVGIPAEHLGHIFDPFFTTKLGQGGSGLGLHIVHTLVTDLLGGSISVSSLPGQGAHFQIVLPKVAPQER